jgi:hypothetical protein
VEADLLSARGDHEAAQKAIERAAEQVQKNGLALLAGELEEAMAFSSPTSQVDA